MKTPAPGIFKSNISITKNLICLILGATVLAMQHGRANDAGSVFNLSDIADGKSWKVSDATAEALVVDGKKVAHLRATGDSANGDVGLALANGKEFSTGEIELDLKAMSPHRGFLGIAFNVTDTKTFEAIYFRPFNFRTNEPYRLRAVQYLAWPRYTWERLRENSPGQYEKPINPPPHPEGWFHARIEVTAKQVLVFVNRAPEPSLAVQRLATGGVKRPFGLFVDSHDGLYANLQVRPTTARF